MALNVPYGCFAAKILKSSKVSDFTLTETLYLARLPTYLARAFRHHYGCTVGEYVRRLRIEFACRELSDSEKPLALIAQNAGFFDQSHFSRTFKLLTGQSPAAYRKLLRDG